MPCSPTSGQKKLALGTHAKLRTLDFLLKKHARDRTLIFTSDNDTVHAISAAFLIPALTHQPPTKERKAILEAFNHGEYLALATSKVLNEGVNIPEASVAIILSGFRLNPRARATSGPHSPQTGRQASGFVRSRYRGNGGRAHQ